jgi:hypothetical protein
MRRLEERTALRSAILQWSSGGEYNTRGFEGCNGRTEARRDGDHGSVPCLFALKLGTVHGCPSRASALRNRGRKRSHVNGSSPPGLEPSGVEVSGAQSDDQKLW